MTRRSHRVLVGSLLAAVALIMLSARARAQDVARMTMEERIAQVIYDTGKMSKSAGSPGRGAAARYALPGEEGGRRVWGYKANVDDVDGKGIAWNFQVRLLPVGYRPDPAVEARWIPYAIGADRVTGGDTFFRESKQNQVRRTRVYYRLTRGDTQVLMTVTREGNETAAQAAEKAANRWRFFVADAEAYGLFDLVRIDVTVLPGPTQQAETEPLRNAEVVQFLEPHGRAVDLPLSVRVRAPEIVADKPYELKVKMKDVLGRPGVSLRAGGSNLRAGPDGWMSLPVARGDTPAKLAVHFEPYDLARGEDLRGRVLDQVAQVRIEYRAKAPAAAAGGTGAAYDVTDAASDEVVRARIDLAAQRGDWWPVVTRMELEAARPGGGGALPAAVPGGAAAPPNWGRIPEALRTTFNEARVSGGDLKEAWDRLLPVARSRPGAGDAGASMGTPVFTSEEPVLLGFRLDRRTASDFLTAEVASDRPNLQGSQVDVPLGWVIDVQIVTPVKLPSGDFDLPEMAGDAAPAAPAARDAAIADPLQAEAEVRRLVNVQSLSLTVRRVGEHGYGFFAKPSGPADPAQAQSARQGLAKDIRLPAGFLPLTKSGVREVVLMKEAFGRPLLDDYFPMAMRDKSLRDRGPAEFPMRNEGLYELRLRMSLYYREPDDHKEVDVAVRTNVVPVGFGVMGLQYESRRLAPK